MINSTVGLRFAPRKRYVPPAPPKRLRAGPLIGLRDSLDPLVSRDPTRAVVIENMYPLELDKPTAFVSRPGFDQAGSQLGAANKRTGQLVYQFTKLDGTEYTVAIVGGQGIYTYNWSTEAWTQVVTVANLTTNSITLSETAHVYAVTFTNKMVVSDGVNTPWMWDGASGAGGLTKLTNAPVFYGQPTVYYSKLFAIKNTARNVIVWSEEQDATLGYETSPYANAWTLGQTDQEGLVAIVGTNEALYYFRERSIGAITGAVSPDFQTEGTREGISETIGTSSLSGVIYRDKRLFFVDAQGRPHYTASGLGAVPVWEDVQETLTGVDQSTLSNAIAVYDPATQLVLLGMSELGQSDPSMLLAYNPVLNVPVAVWRGFTFQALGVVKNGSGLPTLMHIDSTGYAYDHGRPNGVLWDDELNAGTAAVRHVIETAHLGPDTRNEKRFMRADVLMRADADASVINLAHETPYGDSTAQAGSVTGYGDRWGEFDWDDGVWAANTVERHIAFGLNATGRWIRVRVSHEVLTEEFGFEGLTVDYTEAGSHPLAV